MKSLLKYLFFLILTKKFYMHIQYTSSTLISKMLLSYHTKYIFYQTENYPTSAKKSTWNWFVNLLVKFMLLVLSRLLGGELIALQ